MVMKIFLILGVTFLFATAVESKSIQNDSMNNELAKLKQSMAEIVQQVQSLNESLQNKNNHVMFYATIKDKHVSFNKNANLVFETVIVNEGDHYDQYDGVFVAPVKGMYLFSWTVTGHGSDYMVSELVVEERVISSGGEYNGGGGHSSGSMTALCKMDKGDHAWIRTTGVSTAHDLYSYNYYPQSAFLGILIRSDN